MYKLRLIALFAGFAIINSNLIAQDWNKVFQYEQDAEYYMADKLFEKAADTYIKALKVIPNSANYKFKIGYCYLSTDDKKLEALKYLEEAAEEASVNYKQSSLKETKAPLEALYLLAKVYQLNYQFNDAVTAYKKYKELLKPDDKIIPFIDKSIASCNNARDFISDSVSVRYINLGAIINNDESNINAVVSGDGKTLAYTNIVKNGNDIYISNKVNDSWSAPKKITTQLGNKFLLTSFLSFDGKDLYLTSEDPVNNEIFVTTLEKNKWIKPIKFGKPINTKSNENHACLSKDGNTIYFTSDRKGGLGGFDIYKSTVNDKGTWGEPVSVGSSINTEFNEATPYLSADENYLFFSSEGHNSMGGYDVFYVNLTGNPKVVNLGYPINTPDNNLFYCPENNWKSGYLSYFDNKSIGKKDIYHVDISRFININGKIIADANSTPFKVAIVDTEKNDTLNVSTSTDKNFTYRVGTGNYKVIVSNDKFTPFAEDLIIPDEYTNKDYNFEAHLLPLVIEQPKPIAEVVKPKEIKVDSIPVKKPEVIVPKETKTDSIPVKKPEVVKPKETKKPEPEKPKEVLKEKPREVKKVEKPKIEAPTINISNDDNNSSPKITTYSVQLMALKEDVGADYFKDIENIEITLSPDNDYRYSVGTTESMEEAMATLKRVKEIGYSKAFVRINKENAIYTIQIMALKKPVELSYFNNLSGVNVIEGSDGFYRYSFGSFSSTEEAKNSLQLVIDSGYKNAFIKKVKKIN